MSAVEALLRDSEQTDVVVVGAGMGGVTAALAAVEDGASVTLLEKGAEPGGSFAISGGYVWTLRSLEDYRRLVPYGDPLLGRMLVDDFDTGIAWLVAHGVRFGPVHGGLGPDREGRGTRIEPDPVSGALTPMLAAFRAAGGHLQCSAPVVALEYDSDGAVVGVRHRDAAGRVHVLRCSAVVLATGGFQNDAEMMARFVSPWCDRALLRSSPHSTGDGLRLALAAGASVSGGLNAVYGHVMPAYPREPDPGAFRALTQFYVEECILLNLRGERFVDESRAEAACGLELLHQPEARGFIVFDERRHRAEVMEPFVPDALRVDPVEVIRAAGGVVLQSETREELCRAMAEHAVPYATSLSTIAGFDAAASAGDASTLPVSRARGLHRCDTPPFFAVPVRAGITFTEGGVRVDTECRALDRDGRPIPGLFVAGVDAGNVSNVGYAGALSAALVTGLRAGVYAARRQPAVAR